MMELLHRIAAKTSLKNTPQARFNSNSRKGSKTRARICFQPQIRLSALSSISYRKNIREDESVWFAQGVNWLTTGRNHGCGGKARDLSP
jgi:hypothetical protein